MSRIPNPPVPQNYPMDGAVPTNWRLPETLIDMLADLAEKSGRDSMLDIAAHLSSEQAYYFNE